MANYNLKVYPPEELNMEAHPGGGTEVVEVPSFEGLVEDIYEAQKRFLQVALKEPAMARVAKLAQELEGLGFITVANKVDSCLYKIAKDNKSEFFKLLENAKVAIERTRESKYLDFRGDKFDSLIDIINETESAIRSERPDFKAAERNLNILLSDEVLTGEYSKISLFGFGNEIDLESWMSAPNLHLYTNSLLRAQDILGKIIKEVIDERKQSAREREDVVVKDDLHQLRTSLHNGIERFAKLNKEIEDLLKILDGDEGAAADKILKSNEDHLYIIAEFKFKKLPQIEAFVGDKGVSESVLKKLNNKILLANESAFLILTDLRKL